MSINKDEKKLLYMISSDVARKAKEIAPVDTHNLQRDIKVYDDHIDQGYVEVGNSLLAPYAPFVHKGTGIFGEYQTPIVPKNKKALKTPYGFRKSVKGQKANPYLDNALESYVGSGALDKQLNAYGEKVCKDLAADIKKAFGKLLK